MEFSRKITIWIQGWSLITNFSSTKSIALKAKRHQNLKTDTASTKNTLKHCLVLTASSNAFSDFDGFYNIYRSSRSNGFYVSYVGYVVPCKFSWNIYYFLTQDALAYSFSCSRWSSAGRARNAFKIHQILFENAKSGKESDFWRNRTWAMKSSCSPQEIYFSMEETKWIFCVRFLIKHNIFI